MENGKQNTGNEGCLVNPGNEELLAKFRKIKSTEAHINQLVNELRAECNCTIFFRTDKLQVTLFPLL